jgi:hypothetical protein
MLSQRADAAQRYRYGEMLTSKLGFLASQPYFSCPEFLVFVRLWFGGEDWEVVSR